MAKGISIGIGADTRAFAQGVKSGVLEPLEDTVRALEDVDRKGSGLELEDTMRESQRATARLRDENEQLADAIRQAGRRGRDFGDDVRAGTREASAGLDDFKSEAGQSARESAASFRGEWDDVGDFAQETLANGLAGFGPLGVAAGIAAAAGLGTLWQSIQTGSEESEQRVADMFQDMLESGQSYLSESYIQDAIGAIGEDAAKFADAMAEADRLGVSVQTVLRASVGDQEAINAVIDATNAKRDAELAKLAEQADGSAAVAAEQDAVNLKADETIRKYQAISGEASTAAGRAAAVSAAFSTGNGLLDAQLRKVQDIAAAMGGIGNKTIKIDADTTGVEGAFRRLQGRTITVNVAGQITRIGNQVW